MTDKELQEVANEAISRMLKVDTVETVGAMSGATDDMSQELYDAISGGRVDFLRDHKRFQEDITNAVEILEKML